MTAGARQIGAPPAWRLNQYVVSFAVFVAFLGFTFVMPFLPNYVRELGIADLGRVAAWSGLLFGISPLIAGLLAPAWGVLADRFGRKLMVQRSLFCFIFILLAMGFVRNVSQLLLLRIAVGAVGGFGAMALAMVASSTPAQEMGRAVGMVQMSRLLAVAVGPAAGGLMADLFGLRPSFYLASALVAVAFLLVTLWYREVGATPAERRRQPSVPLRRIAAIPHIPQVLLLLFLASFGERVLGPITPIYVAELGTPPELVQRLAGLIMSLGAGAAALSASWAGRLADWYPLRSLLLLLPAGAVLVSIPMGFVDNAYQFLALRILMGLCAGGVLTLSYTAGARLVSAQSQGAAFGLFSSAAMIGGALGPMVIGLVAAWQLVGVFWASALLYGLLLAWVWWRLWPPREPGPIEAPHGAEAPAQPE